VQLDAEQRAVASEIVRRARRRGLPLHGLLVKAAFQTGLVESNLRNLAGGDADSQGWRQERASLYRDPRNLGASIERFFDEAQAVKGQYGRAGDLAAAVQRPAAQYRGRYQAVSGDAEALIRQFGGGGGGGDMAEVDGGAARAPELAALKTATEAGGGSPGQQLAAVLSGAELARPMKPQSVGLAAPVFAAQPVAPAGAKVVASAGQVRESPGASLSAALSAVRGLGGVEVTQEPRMAAGGAGGAQAAPVGEEVGAGAAVAFAQSRVGQYREDAGSNRGGQLDTLQRRFGMSGQPWCAMFTSVAVTRGGAPKVARTASVAVVREQVTSGKGGYERGFKGRARAGDLWLRGNAHVGLVESVDEDGTIHTIEGNTGSGEVARRTHRPGEGQVARPRYAR
jgi:hypothetical protein